jgi:hypothetical protein
LSAPADLVFVNVSTMILRESKASGRVDGVSAVDPTHNKA